MKQTIDGIEYNLIPQPPYLSPFTRRAAQLLKNEPQSLEEAQRNSEEIKQCMEKIFAETVKPQPKIEHYVQVFNAINELTNQVIKDAEFFRKPKRSNIGKSRHARDYTSETPK